MPTAPEPAARLPFRRLVLMPWRWSRWILVLLVALSPILYLSSAVPVVYVLRKCGVKRSSTAFNAMVIAYYPLVWIERNSAAGRDVLKSQMDGMETLFGELHD